MTNKERLISLLGFAPPVNTAEGALLDAGISEIAVYDPVYSKALKGAAIEVIKIILSTADTTNAVTGFSIRYDRAAIEKRLKALENEIGLTDYSVTIKARDLW